MKNGKIFISNGQPKILPVSLVDGAWVGYVPGEIVTTTTAAPTTTTTTTTTATPTTTTTTTTAPGVTVPGAPTSVVAYEYGPGISLEWTDPTNNGGAAITGYEVQFQLNNDGWMTASLTPLSGYRGYFDPYASANFIEGSDTFTFRVAAVNSVGTGNFSSPSNSLSPGGQA